jgi:hypothetical protein
LSIYLITQRVSEHANSKVAAANDSEKVELLTILAGRLYALGESAQKDDTLQEIQMYVSTAYSCLHNRETREAALDVIRALPARTSAEVNYIVQVAQDVQDQDTREDIQTACGVALRYVSTKVPETRAALEQAELSPVGVIREAAIRMLH